LDKDRVAQVSNLLYRRFPIGSALEQENAVEISRDQQAGSAAIQQVGNLRYSSTQKPRFSQSQHGYR